MHDDNPNSMRDWVDPVTHIPIKEIHSPCIKVPSNHFRT